MSLVDDQRCRWSEQDHAIVSVESSTSSDQEQRRPDVRSPYLGTQSIWRHNQLMTGSRTQVLPWFSCRDWNTVSSHVLGSSTVQTPSRDYAEFILDTLGYVEPMKLHMCQLRQAAVELPAIPLTTRAAAFNTRVGACWWLPLEPRRRQRCSSRRETSQRHAPVLQQTLYWVHAGCVEDDEDGRSKSRWCW